MTVVDGPDVEVPEPDEDEPSALDPEDLDTEETEDLDTEEAEDLDTEEAEDLEDLEDLEETEDLDTEEIEEAEDGDDQHLDVTEPDVAPAQPAADLSGTWTGTQLATVARQALLVMVGFGLIGYGLGFVRGGGHTARAEFIYTLDESVPDSFLREDRRLLTQVVTFSSDAVLTPVAADFDLSVDDLRSRINVETLNLSEVLQLEVRDGDADQAVALNRAVLAQYLAVTTKAAPVGTGDELLDQRSAIVAELEAADGQRLGLLQNREQDTTLQLRQESLQRRITIKINQVAGLQQNLDSVVLRQAGGGQLAIATETLDAAEAELADLEAELAAVGTDRAELVTATTAEPALLREIDRLEAKLATVDNELAERELAPLVAAPIRELGQPIVQTTSRHLGGAQGMAVGLLLAVPVAALVALRRRRQQLWFD